MKKLIICFLLLSACGKKSFEAAAPEKVVTTSETDDSIMQLHQITSGGGTVYAEDNSFIASTTIGSAVYTPTTGEDDILVSLGLFDILKNEF